MLSAWLNQSYDRLGGPSGRQLTSRVHWLSSTALRQHNSQITGPGGSSRVPATILKVPHPIRRGVLQGSLAPQGLQRFYGLHPDFGDSTLPAPHQRAGPLTTPQASRHAGDRSDARPQGLSTLGSDRVFRPRRQSAAEPADSYRTVLSMTTHARSPPIHWSRERPRSTAATHRAQTMSAASTSLCRGMQRGRWVG